jgi:predicted nucleic-acid-binding Zn-ribbon protein
VEIKGSFWALVKINYNAADIIYCSTCNYTAADVIYCSRCNYTAADVL